jgi:hypothetical protein
MNYLALILQLLPVVFQSVLSVEQILGNLPGAAKKQLVQATVQATATAAGNAPLAAPVLAATSTLIDSTVSALNTAGVFKTSQVGSAPPSA